MPSPAFQFYPGDFLSDGNQMAMSLAGAGAYIRLLSVCWKEGSLPDDAKILWKLAQADSRQEFEEVWPSVRVCFKARSNGTLYHPRLEREKRKQDDYRKKMSESGKKGAYVRHAKSASAKDNPSQAIARPQPGLGDPQALQSSVFSLRSSVSVKETVPAEPQRNVVGERVDLVLAHTEQQTTKAQQRSELARLIFTYWAARTAKDPKRTKWDEKRESRLTARLKENQDDVCELLCVVDGALNDDFHNSANGNKYLQIQTIFRDREMVEKLAVLSPHFGKDVHPFMAAP